MFAKTVIRRDVLHDPAGLHPRRVLGGILYCTASNRHLQQLESMGASLATRCVSCCCPLHAQHLAGVQDVVGVEGRFDKAHDMHCFAVLRNQRVHLA